MLAAAPYAHNDVLSAVFSSVSLTRPHWRPPSGWTEHGPFAFWLIQAIRPSSFVELGTHYGYSFFSVCQAVEECGLNTKCVAIDTWSGDEHAGHYGSEVLQAARREVRRYEAFATLRQSTFHAALAEFEDRSIDLLHIDGRHRYEDACRDWSTWLPKIPNAASCYSTIRKSAGRISACAGCGPKSAIATRHLNFTTAMAWASSVLEKNCRGRSMACFRLAATRKRPS